MKADDLHLIPLKRRSLRGLHARMAFSYVWVTTLLMLFVEIAIILLLFFALSQFVLPELFKLGAIQAAQRYALAATMQAEQGALNPRSTFQVNQPASLILPGMPGDGEVTVPFIDARSASTNPVRFALLIAPDGRVLASTYPHRYPPAMLVSTLLPQHAQDIAAALNGKRHNGSMLDPAGPVAYALETVWGQAGHPLGAVYVQLPIMLQDTSGAALWQPGLTLLIISTLVLLLVIVPLSMLFGFFTTRPMIRRLRDLGVAFARVAGGDYSRRIVGIGEDEIGHLERQFNLMAQQLATSLAHERLLSEQNVRLAERARISRDLHDSVKQHIFAVSMQIGAALSHLERKPENTRQHLQNAGELTYQAQQELNKMIYELRPAAQAIAQAPEAARETESVDALRAYVVNWGRQNQLPVNITIVETLMLPPDIQIELLRVAQEALSNIVRHSQATQVHFSLTSEQTQVVLTISDNGCGFDPSSRLHSGVGLHSMRERMEELGGSCEIVSQVNQGTCVTARVPYHDVLTQ